MTIAHTLGFNLKYNNTNVNEELIKKTHRKIYRKYECLYNL